MVRALRSHREQGGSWSVETPIRENSNSGAIRAMERAAAGLTAVAIGADAASPRWVGLSAALNAPVELARVGVFRM